VASRAERATGGPTVAPAGGSFLPGEGRGKSFRVGFDVSNIVASVTDSRLTAVEESVHASKVILAGYTPAEGRGASRLHTVTTTLPICWFDSR
jgi:hypothetical protein